MRWIKFSFRKNVVTAADETSDVHPLIKAIDDGHEVTMIYRGNNTHPDERIEPRTVIPTRVEGDHVVAFDIAKNAWRKFFPGQRPGPSGMQGVEKIVSTAPASIAREDLPPEEEKPAKTWKRPAPAPAPAAPSIQKSEPGPPVWLNDDARPWETLPGSVQNFRSVEPTEDEYKELQALDIDPATFDRATVKRLRNMGVSHLELKDALSNQVKIPLEDYETARINNPDNHLQAKQEAERYQTNYYQTLIQENNQDMSKPELSRYAGRPFLSDEKHDSLVEDLFGHHLTLKNLPTEMFGSINPQSFTRYQDPDTIPWRRRANEWILHECSKLSPSLRDYFTSSDPDVSEPFTTHYDTNDLLNSTEHSKIVDTLLKHYNFKMVNSRTVRDLIINKRKHNALINIATSQHLPWSYSQDQYEREPREQ